MSNDLDPRCGLEDRSGWVSVCVRTLTQKKIRSVPSNFAPSLSMAASAVDMLLERKRQRSRSHSRSDVIYTFFQDQDQDLFVTYTRGRPKSIFIFGRKWKCRRKWNFIYGRKRNENGHSFSAEKRKRKSPDNISFFHTFSHQVSPTMLRQYLVQFRLFAGGPSWRDSTFLMYSGVFLNDISTREQFVFLVYCYRVKAIATTYALCFTGVCVA